MNKLSTIFCTLSFSFLNSGLAISETPSHGVLALLDVNDTVRYDNQLSNFEEKAQSMNCTILREGPVVAEDGDIDLDQPNRFIYFDCKTSLLGSPDGRDFLADLGKGSDYIAAMEGTPFFQDTVSFKKQAGERSYILKVSHYNNSNPTKRDLDLAHLGETVRPRDDAYQLESFLGTTQAYGMTTPDEAVVLYYDTTAAGDRFRDNNPDVLDKVVDFNDKHLTDYIYYIAQSRR
ncbi:hypothetical protein [Kiloniella sp.]|uniref:hypothetical protein n=1 Tax=Kiloniella sp. TaxID=1938587 RepID=UPI003B0235DC